MYRDATTNSCQIWGRLLKQLGSTGLCKCDMFARWRAERRLDERKPMLNTSSRNESQHWAFEWLNRYRCEGEGRQQLKHESERKRSPNVEDTDFVARNLGSRQLKTTIRGQDQTNYTWNSNYLLYWIIKTIAYNMADQPKRQWPELVGKVIETWLNYFYGLK